MNLYIRKKYEYDIKNNRDKFETIVPLTPLEFRITENNLYEVGFSIGISFFGLDADTTYKMFLQFNYNTYSNYTFYIKDYYTGDVLDEVLIDEFDNPIEFNFTTESNRIIIDSEETLHSDYWLNKITIIDDLNYYKVHTEEDFNIVYNMNNLETLNSLTVPYSKTVKIYNNEFNKDYWLNMFNVLKYKYDCYVNYNEDYIFSGELVLNEKVNDDYYNCVLKSDISDFRNITSLKVKDFFTETLEYTYDDYSSYTSDPDSYEVYKYYTSRDIKEDDFLNATSKEDFTKFYDGTTLDYIDATNKWNFNSYIRPAVSYKYLFDTAHKLSNFNYTLDDGIDIDNLVVTNNFYKAYGEDSIDRTLTYSVVFDVREGANQVISDTDLLIDGSSYDFEITTGIADFNFENFIMSAYLDQNYDRTITLTTEMSLYTANSLGSKDVLLGTYTDNTNMIGRQTNPVPALWQDPYEIEFPLDVDYHYSKYGYVLHIKVLVTSGVIYNADLNNLYVSIDGFTTNVDRQYYIYTEGSDIPLTNLVPQELTFLDVIKNIINMYNVFPVIDYKTNTINYKLISSMLDSTINLTSKYDINKKSEKYNTFNNKIIYSYNEPPQNDNIYYDNVINNRLSTDNEFNVNVDSNIVFDALYSGSLNNYFYDDPSFTNTGYDAGNFIILSDADYYENNKIFGLGFVDVLTGYGTDIGGINDWNLRYIGAYNKYTSVSSINFDNNYGLWFNKNEFDNITYYRWWYYDDIDDIESMYDKFYSDYNEAIYKYGPVKFVSDFYLTNQEINTILEYNFIIIENNKYIVDKMTVSNKKTNLELIKYLK